MRIQARFKIAHHAMLVALFPDLFCAIQSVQDDEVMEDSTIRFSCDAVAAAEYNPFDFIGLFLDDLKEQQEREEQVHEKRRRRKSQQAQWLERKQKSRDIFPLPSHCEYCGASSLQDCENHKKKRGFGKKKCQRPKSYFQKQRPPFASKGDPRWNPVTELENEKIDHRQFVEEYRKSKRLESSNSDHDNNNASDWWSKLWK